MKKIYIILFLILGCISYLFYNTFEIEASEIKVEQEDLLNQVEKQLNFIEDEVYFTVVLDLNGGSYNGDYSFIEEQYPKNSLIISLDETSLHKSNSQFLGWFLDNK